MCLTRSVEASRTSNLVAASHRYRMQDPSLTLGMTTRPTLREWQPGPYRLPPLRTEFDMPVFEAIRLALAQIRVQKLKSFFTLIGVAIGVMFLIAIVSIVEGVGRYMEDDLVGKLITKNSFELRTRPNIQMGDIDESEWRSWRNRPRIKEEDVPVVVAALPPSARWAVEGSGSLTFESRYAKPRNVSI